VTGKGWTPDGADPHDFVHVADYAWPDPDAPDGLPWVLRDGHRNPAAGRLAADGTTLRHFGEAITALGLGAWLDDDARHARRIVELVDTFFCAPATGMRPMLRFGVVIPGRPGATGWGLARMQPLSDVIDSVELLTAVGPNPDAGVADRFRVWCSRFLDWLLASELLAGELARGNNHATWATELTLALAAHVGEAAAVDEVLARAETLLEAQVGADGTQPAEDRRPRSFYYRGFNAHGMLRIAERAAPWGLDLLGPGAAPRRAVDALLPALADPGRRGPLGPERSDRHRHGDLLVRIVATWPSVEDYRSALAASDLRPPPDHPVWLECGVDPGEIGR
jgi:hypothetical protein